MDSDDNDGQWQVVLFNIHRCCHEAVQFLLADKWNAPTIVGNGREPDHSVGCMRCACNAL